MSHTIPICGLKKPVEDPNYRYQMPHVITKVEGRGNGIRTVIPNIRAIANSLHREPEEITKFIGVEVGAQQNCDLTNDKYWINGQHQVASFQKMIHKYIDFFVLCPNCGLPETSYVSQRGGIYQSCKSCGTESPIDVTSVSTQRTARVISNYLGGGKGGKKGKKGKKALEEKNEDDDVVEDEEEDEENQVTSSKSEKKAKKEKKEKKKEKKEKKEKKHKKSKKEKSSDDENSNQGDDNSDDPELTSTTQSLSISGSSEEYNLESAVLALREKTKDADVSNILNAILEVKEERNAPIEELEKIFVVAFFTKKSCKKLDIQTYKSVFLGLIGTEEPKSGQLRIIEAIEFFCSMGELLSKLPQFLLQLYQEELVTEEVLFDWKLANNADKSKSDVMAEVGPFFEWLNEPTEEI